MEGRKVRQLAVKLRQLDVCLGQQGIHFNLIYKIKHLKVVAAQIW
jgi:hypothetical protein